MSVSSKFDTEINMATLVVADMQGSQLKSATFHTIHAALQLGSSITVLVAGYRCQPAAATVATTQGVSRVLVVDSEAYRYPLAENMSCLIADIAPQYRHVLIAATTTGKDIMPRVAGLLKVAQISDVIAIQSNDTFIRPIYAGSAYQTVRATSSIGVMTVRMSAFSRVPIGGEAAAAPIESLDTVYWPNNTTLVSQQVAIMKRPELANARVIVSGGRGMKSKEHFKMLEVLADKLGAAIGASRAAVDAGFVTNDCQIGQTGKMVAPDLYIAVGISGAIQHIAGIKDSKVIVAINQDPDAPIFQVADYGLVGDLFTIVPQLIAALS
jgi:electron transfer flavoprotein alpha subunit